MKMLYILNTANKVNNFSYSSMIAALQLCYEFHIAGNWTNYNSKEERKVDEEKYGIKIHQIDFIRAPYHPKNRIAYKQLLELCQKEKFDVIHCNTPIGGVLGRIVGEKCKVPKIIYEAHGFHFYKGSPILNWLIYYPIEKWLAHKTDVLITINKEDYELARKRMHLRTGGKVEYVPGVGIDTAQYLNERTARIDKRKELGLAEDDVALISMGDLIDRKNYPMAINGLARLNNCRVHYFICGKGPDEEKLKALTSTLGIENQVHFLGFRTDIKELLNAADVFVLTSKQEGLARSLMEGMASGLPCIASKIRGNTDILDEQQGGFLVANEKDVSDAIQKLLVAETRQRMSVYNLEKITGYSIEGISGDIKNVYSSELNGGVQPN